MSHVISFVLSLAGSLCATWSLLMRDTLRKADPSTTPRLPPRLVLSLLFLGSAAAAQVAELLNVNGLIPPLSWIDLGFLLAGAGATLWAFRSTHRRPDEKAAERISPRGKLALGLLAAGLAVDLSTGRVVEAFGQFHMPAGGTTSLLGLLAVLLAALSIVAATFTLRLSNPLVPGTGSVLRRASTGIKVTFAMLCLTLAGTALTAAVAPGSGLLLCLLLLMLGTGAWLLALSHKAQAATAEGPAAWGIPARGWVSLALLGAAGLVLGDQEVRSLSGPRAHPAKPAARSVEESNPAVPLVDDLSTWSLRGAVPALPGSTDPERARLEKELVDLRRSLAALRDRLNSEQAPSAQQVGATTVVDMSTWRQGAAAGQPPAATGDLKASLARLEGELAELRRKLAEAPATPPRQAGNPSTPSTIDMRNFRSDRP